MRSVEVVVVVVVVRVYSHPGKLAMHMNNDLSVVCYKSLRLNVAKVNIHASYT